MTAAPPPRAGRGKKIPRSFYLRETPAVARELLGKYLIRRHRRTLLIAKIVETEAYCADDPASHSFRGRTRRNEVMFGEGGHLYVYFTYGMHFCANIVTREEGNGEAVLIRAVEPLEGIGVMKQNRPAGGDTLYNLTNGPAKFCQAFGISGKQNGTDLLGDDIYLTEGEDLRRSEILSSGRVGIRSGVEQQWRFFIGDNPFVSRRQGHVG